MRIISRRISQLFGAIAALACLSAFSIAKADSPLEISMQHMKKAYKDLSLDLQTPQESDRAAYLALAGKLKSEAVKARSLVPNKAEDLPPDQKAAMVAAYQKSMDGFAASVDALSQQIGAAQWDAARKSVAALSQEMVDGHAAFRKKE